MKKQLSLLIAIAAIFCVSNPVQAQFDKLKQKIKDKVNQRVDDKEDQSIDKGLDSVEYGKKKNGNSNSNSNSSTSTTSSDNISNTASFKTYQNYDFIPGDTVLFEDHFVDDQDGEFPSHWELIAGQGVLNSFKGDKAFLLTDGNYVRVRPRVKKQYYLTDPFTIEYDTYFVPGSYGVIIMLKYGEDREAILHETEGEVSFMSEGVDLSKILPDNMKDDNYRDKWHHIAIAYKNKQLKVYVDQSRILVVPDTRVAFNSIEFAGIGQDAAPLVFKNIRVASGGQMNMIGKKFTETKIVTHGINFDIDKATIKPESMGTLNMIVQVLKDNTDIKFEVDGHTDNSGTATHNLTLSQQRADAVRTQLVSMGIDASRLTSKGFGDTKPVSDNNTLEGKANNRRVEFVKM